VEVSAGEYPTGHIKKPSRQHYGKEGIPYVLGHDFAFLLGYEDTTSFLRAFTTWTGQTVTEYKHNQRI